jgi:hypothetical protein
MSRDVKWKFRRSANEFTWIIVTVNSLREAGNSKTLCKFRGMSKSFHHKGIDFTLHGVGIEKIYSLFLKATWSSFSTACWEIN